MAELTEDVKLFIVQQLATWRTPSAVAELVKQEFGLEISRQQVRTYNPRQCKVKEKWSEIFEATRDAFKAAVADLAMAQQAYRIRELGELYDLVKGRKAVNVAMARELLEQGAKDAGGVFTNRRELSGSVNVSLADAIKAAREMADDGGGGEKGPDDEV